MTLKRFLVVLVLLSFCTLFAGCGGGSSSSTAEGYPGAGGTSAADGSGINPPATGGDTASGSGSNTGTELTWDAPATNVDGTLLTDLAGYKIYYGNSSGAYTAAVAVGAATNYILSDLAPGTYYMVVTAYNADGNESDFSNEVTKTVL